MARELVNLDDRNTKLRLIQRIGAMTGPWWVELVRFRRNRSLNQNRLYWGIYVEAFRQYMHGCGNTHWDAEMCHEALRLLFLKEMAVNTGTGEMLTTTRSTTSLDTTEFSEYLDKIEQFLRDDCGVILPAREMFYEGVA